MDIDKIRIFISVAEHKSFTKAAEAMYISQPTLSRNIADLESILKVELFERTTRKVNLTEAGELFLKEACHIIQKYDALMERIARLGSGISGNLSVGYLEIFTQDILPIAIREYKRKFPLVDLQLKEMTLHGVSTALAEGSIDIGFTLNHKNSEYDENSNYTRILTGEVELAVGKDHPLAGYKVVSPSVLKDEIILTFNKAETPKLREGIAKMCIDNGFIKDFRDESLTPGAIFLLVQAGVGVTLISSLVTSILKRTNDFRTLKLDGINIPTYLDLVWRKNNKNPCILNFCEEVKKAAHPNDY